MVFHSHYMVTDKKTGIIHSLCCYKECSNPQTIVKDDETEKDNNIIENTTTTSDLLLKSDDEYLSRNEKDEKIRKKSSSENEKFYSSDSSIRPKKSPQKKSLVFKLKIPSDIVSESYRKRYKAYKEATMNSVPSGYSSDEYIEMDTDTELDSVVTNSSTKPIEKNLQISEKVDNNDREFNEKECFEIDSTDCSTLSEDQNSTITSSPTSNSDNNFNPDTKSQQKPNQNNNFNFDTKSQQKPNQYDNFNLDTKSQQKSNQESVEPFHKAVEDARSAMIALIDKFCFEQYSSSPVVQSLQENCLNTSKIDQEALGTQEEMAVVISKPNIINTDKISFGKKKSKQIKSQFGTPEFPIDLDNDDNVRSRVKPPVLDGDEDNVMNERNSLVKSVQSHDNLMINWFDRDDFKKFMLVTAKRRLEELDDYGQNSKKRIKVSGRPSSSSFRNSYGNGR
jgi:hypothetical protein